MKARIGSYSSLRNEEKRSDRIEARDPIWGKISDRAPRADPIFFAYINRAPRADPILVKARSDRALIPIYIWLAQDQNWLAREEKKNQIIIKNWVMANPGIPINQFSIIIFSKFDLGLLICTNVHLKLNILYWS